MTVRTCLAAAVAVALTATLGTLTPSPSAAAAGRPCAHPRFVTTSPHGRWPTGGYWVDNDVWNGAGHAVRQRLAACSAGTWRVSARVGRPTDTWSVKSYPNVHRDWHDWTTGAEPSLSLFRVLRSSVSARLPSGGIHNAAYDVWLDGVPGVPGVREVMVWTSRTRMRPMGRVVRRGVHLGGRTWAVWATADGSYTAFVPRHDFRAGTVRLRAHLTWLVRHGLVPADATLGQIGFGFEIIATARRRQTFRVDAFSLTART